MKVYFLHGFLGSLGSWNDVFQYLHKDIEAVALPYPFALPDEARRVVGYSMGGRIALASAHRLEKLLLFSAHPGLTSSEERSLRWQQDRQWAHLLRTRPMTEFLDAWYAQPIFASLQRRPELLEQVRTRCLQHNPFELADQLERHSLAHQPLFERFSNVLFAYGAEDTRYATLYRERQLPALQIPNCSHPVYLEQPEYCAHAIANWLFS